MCQCVCLHFEHKLSFRMNTVHNDLGMWCMAQIITWLGWQPAQITSTHPLLYGHICHDFRCPYHCLIQTDPNTKIFCQRPREINYNIFRMSAVDIKGLILQPVHSSLILEIPLGFVSFVMRRTDGPVIFWNVLKINFGGPVDFLEDMWITNLTSRNGT